MRRSYAVSMCLNDSLFGPGGTSIFFVRMLAIFAGLAASRTPLGPGAPSATALNSDLKSLHNLRHICGRWLIRIDMGY